MYEIKFALVLKAKTMIINYLKFNFVISIIVLKKKIIFIKLKSKIFRKCSYITTKTKQNDVTRRINSVNP